MFANSKNFDGFSPGGDKVDQVDPHSLCRQFRKWQLHSQCLSHLLLPVASCYRCWKWSGGMRNYQRHEITLSEFYTLFFVIPWAFTENPLVKVWLALHFETLKHFQNR